MDWDKEFAEKIEDNCMHEDWEIAHSDADSYLIELLRRAGYNKTADAWEKVSKWYA